MKNSTLRNLMLDIEELDETKNPFAIAYKMCIALKNDLISSSQYELLSGDLFIACKENNIETKNEICSLF